MLKLIVRSRFNELVVLNRVQLSAKHKFYQIQAMSITSVTKITKVRTTILMIIVGSTQGCRHLC